MALKDWKKKVLETEGKIFHAVYIAQNGRRIYIANQSFGSKYYVEFAWGNHDYKLFNTKSQALAFAKSYMRTH